MVENFSRKISFRRKHSSGYMRNLVLSYFRKLKITRSMTLVFQFILCVRKDLKELGRKWTG